jgi:hypothetical protein
MKSYLLSFAHATRAWARDVAIKALPSHLPCNSARKARFEREAKAIWGVASSEYLHASTAWVRRMVSVIAWWESVLSGAGWLAREAICLLV